MQIPAPAEGDANADDASDIEQGAVLSGFIMALHEQ